MQFIQKENKIDILYSGLMPEQDKIVLNNFFKEFNVEFKKDKFIRIFDKVPTYYNNLINRKYFSYTKKFFY